MISAVLAGAGFFGVAPLQGQSLQQIMQVMQDGGTWLSLPIEDGRGTFTGATVPTMGMSLEGWFQVSDVHRGEWSIKVVDLTRSPGATVVETRAKPGERIPVVYNAGPTVRVQVDVMWSEPADTVLWVWVGMPAGEPEG